MGKVTGFLEIDRQDRRYKPAADRIRHFKEFMSSTVDLPQKLIDYLNESRAPLPPISDPDEPLRIDSLSLMRLVAFLENELGIRVEDEELTVDNFETARSLARLIGPKTNADSASDRPEDVTLGRSE